MNVRRRLGLRWTTWLAAGLFITLLTAEYCAIWSRARLATIDHFTHDPSTGWLQLAPNPRSAPVGIPPPPSHPHAADRRARLERAADQGWLGGFKSFPATTGSLTTFRGRGLLIESLSMSQGFALDAAEVTIVSAGWPFKCAQARRWMDHSLWKPNANQQWHGALQVPAAIHPQPRYFGPAVFITAPLWPGLVANTAIWTTLVGALHTAAIRTRQARRVRRALCIACAYPVGGLGRCPECGRPAAS